MNAKNALLIVVAIVALAGAILVGFGSAPLDNTIARDEPVYKSWNSPSEAQALTTTNGNQAER